MSFSGIKLFKLIKQFKGIGTPVSKKICLLLGYDFRLKSSFLKKKDLEKIDLLVRERVIVDKSLNFLIKKNIIKSQRIKSYKGKRHAQGLPVRGQRTHSNGLTAKRLSFYKIPKNEIKTKIRKKNDKNN
jgi:small subunit ribosomal protein S13